MDGLGVCWFEMASYLLWTGAHLWTIIYFAWVHVGECTRQDSELVCKISCIVYLKCTDLYAFFIILSCFPHTVSWARLWTDILNFCLKFLLKWYVLLKFLLRCRENVCHFWNEACRCLNYFSDLEKWDSKVKQIILSIISHWRSINCIKFHLIIFFKLLLIIISRL